MEHALQRGALAMTHSVVVCWSHYTRRHVLSQRKLQIWRPDSTVACSCLEAAGCASALTPPAG